MSSEKTVLTVQQFLIDRFDASGALHPVPQMTVYLKTDRVEVRGQYQTCSIDYYDAYEDEDAITSWSGITTVFRSKRVEATYVFKIGGVEVDAKAHDLIVIE